jgi:hypothetical protein
MDLMMFLKARPDLKGRIQMDVVSCGGPGGQVTSCSSLVFDDGNGDHSLQAVHYSVVIGNDDSTEYGSSIECTDDEYQAGLNWGLDKKSQGFE